MRKVLLEACCTSLAQASGSISGGAGRIELCSRIEVGGVTPPVGLIADVVGLGVPVNVLVRPRGGDFVYGPDEVAQMLGSIEDCRRLGAAGVVVGALTPDGDIDLPLMRTLVQAARGNGGQRRLSVTFHRAFDECRDPLDAFGQIVGLGCDRLLTSGHEPTALEGRSLISDLISRASGRIIVMPGSGITRTNLAEVMAAIPALEFHGTRICR